MGVFRRLPGVRSAVHHGSTVKNQLAVIEKRTAELEPGVINTLLYDSSSALEALEHIVVSLRAQDDSAEMLVQHVVALQNWLQQTQASMEASVQAAVGQLQAAAAQRGVNSGQELNAVAHRLDTVSDQLVSVQQHLAGSQDETVSAKRLEALILQVMQRVDRFAVEDQNRRGEAFEQWQGVLDQSTLLEESLLEQLNRLAEGQLHVVETINELDTVLVEQLRRGVRNDFNEDLGAGVDLLTKEIGRVEEVLNDSLNSRTESTTNEWIRLEMALRNELSSVLERSEQRVMKDVAHARDVLSAELNAHTGKLGGDLSRTELSVRDELGRRLADKQSIGSPTLSSIGPALPDPRLIDALGRLEAKTDPLEERLAEQASLSVRLLEALQDVGSGSFGLTAAQQPKPLWDEVRSDPSDPEVALAAAVIPYVNGSLAIDVGAHVGVWSAALVEQGLRVLALEPNPKLASVLRDRFVAQRRVQVVEAAAGGARGTATLFMATDKSPGKLYGDTSLFSTLRCDAPSDEQALVFEAGPQVQCSTIAALHDEHARGAEIALMKIDTEGTGLAVLDGMEGLRPHVVACEFWGREYLLNGPNPIDPAVLIDRMIDLGYRRWIGFVHSGDELQARPNPRSFPPNAWGNLFFFDEVEPFALASRWCNQHLVNGIR